MNNSVQLLYDVELLMEPNTQCLQRVGFCFNQSYSNISYIVNVQYFYKVVSLIFFPLVIPNSIRKFISLIAK